MSKTLKYLCMLIVLLIISIIPNISKAISKSEINQHAWGGIHPNATFWQNDDYNNFYNYINSNFSGINPDFFKNPLLEPSLYHGPSLGSCSTCNNWRQQSGEFLTNVFRSGTRGLVQGSFPLVGNTIVYQQDVNYHTYCIEHSGAFGDEHWLIYNNILYMRIEGNYLTQVTKEGGQTTYPNYLSTSNGRLAYLGYATPSTGFNSTNAHGDRVYGGYGGPFYISGSETLGYTESQRTMWAFINQWYSDVGQYVGVDYTDVKNDELRGEGYGNPASDPIYADALDYANSIGSTSPNASATGTDNTNIDNIKIEMYDRNGEQWTRVGPFNWTFQGTMDSITVTANNGTVSNVLILDSDASTQIQVNQMKSGRNFYITMKADTNLNYISNVQGHFTLPDLITADIYIFKGDSTNIYTNMVLNNNHSANRPFQKVMLIVPGLIKQEGTVETDMSGEPEGGVPITITFTIIKVDEENNTVVLPNVGFKFYNQSAGKYIEILQNGGYQYVDTLEEATELTTDANGRIELEGVPPGTYLAYEITNPNKAYDVTGEPIEFTPSNGSTIQITNKASYISFTIEKVDEDDNSIKLEGVGFKFYNVEEGKYITLDRNNEFTGYVDRIEQATEVETDANGRIQLNYVPMGTYRAYETKNPDKGYDVLGEPIEFTPEDGSNIVITNKLSYISFEIEKVDEDNNEIKLEGVGFKFYNVEERKYITLDRNNEFAGYVDRIEQATEVETDANGRIQLNYVPIGTYLAYETSNPNYGYVVTEEPLEFTPEKDGIVQLTNELKYIKLTGLVWEDIQSEKMSKRNELYRLDRNDDADIPVEGVIVRLKDKQTGEEVTDIVEGLDGGQQLVTETSTNENGEYQFDYVPVDNIGNYYIEFEYDGLIYESVAPHLENEEKGSKADESGREEFNNRFNSMDKGSGDMQTVADQNGNTSERPIVNYEIAETGDGGRLLEMTSTENTEIIATTEETGYNIEYDKKEDTTAEVSNINLGIYKRAQTDLALQTEIEEIKAEINGYGHIYHYGPMYNVDNTQEVESSWDLGIRYQSGYKGTYERPIYKADAEYTNDTDQSKELQLLLTYKITLRNQGSVYGRVNSVAVYFDSRYDDQVVAIGTVLDSKGNITGTTLQGQPQQSNVNGYKKVMINTTELGIIDHSATESTGDNKVTEQSLYIQFRLPREVIAEMIKEGDTPSNNLNFTAEIGSYTSYSDDRGNTLYAAYDVDSVPDNAQVGNESTYEDDTDKASQVALTIANERTISGMIFEDIKEESTENVAEGNGRKDPNETNLTGVKVELIDVSDGQVAQIYDESSETWADVSYDVDNSGNYQIAGFIPGEYQVRFTWGDRTERVTGMPDSEPITVENYKSTIIDYEKYERYDDLPNGEKERYYLSDYGILEENYSIALDDQNIRKQIDESLEEYNFSTDAVDSSGNPITEMQSNTWNMEFPIEYDSEPADGTDILDKLEVTTDARGDTSFTIEFPVANINLGIIKRPEQNIELTKTIDSFKFVLPTGQVLIDAKLNEDGTVSGTTNYLSYIQGPTPEESLLRAELDENLIQGSRVDITYRLEIKNTSEADYSSEWYYNYGEKYYELTGELDKNNDIITLSPLKVIDYLNENSQINEDSQINKDYKWQSISINEIESQEMLTTDVINELKGTGSLELEDYQIYVTDISSIIQTENTGEINFNLKPEYWVGTTLGNGAENTEDIQIETSQPLGNAEDSVYRNQAEIVLVVKTGGGRLISTPGNYVPNYNSEETPDEDDGGSPPATVIPSTGADKNYVIPIFVIIMTFVLLGVGIYLIKVKVLRTKK